MQNNNYEININSNILHGSKDSVTMIC